MTNHLSPTRAVSGPRVTTPRRLIALVCVGLATALSAGTATATAASIEPVAAYTLNGTTADSSGNGNTISWVGTPTYGAGLSATTQAADVSSHTNYLVMPSNSETKPTVTGNFSVAFWIHETETTSDSPILSNQNFVVCNNAGFTIYNESGTTLPRFCVGNTVGGTKDYDMFSTSEDLTSGWHYIALTYAGSASSGGTFTGYFDGQQAFTQTVAAGANITGYGGLVAGYDGSQEDTGDGYIDAGFADLDYYDQTISAAQVASDYAATIPAPPAPTDVTATPVSGSSVKVAWSAAAGAARYDVYDSTTAGGEDTAGVPACHAAAGTSCTVHGLKPGTTYYFTVVASDASGDSPASSEASATPISAPMGLKAVATDGAVKLHWSAYSGATRYTAYYSYSSGAETSSGFTACTASKSADACTVRGLTDSVPYYFVVVAQTTSGTTPPSAQVTATPLGTPRGVRAHAGRRSATISWDAAFGATSYVVYERSKSTRARGHGHAVCVVRARHDRPGRCTVTGLRAGRRYSFVVVARNPTGASPPSHPVAVTLSPRAIAFTPWAPGAVHVWQSQRRPRRSHR